MGLYIPISGVGPYALAIGLFSLILIRAYCVQSNEHDKGRNEVKASRVYDDNMIIMLKENSIS